MTPQIECVSCHHQIDAEARLCPYCGADPRTGERFDPRPLLEKHFSRRGEISTGERVLEFLRARQGIIVTVVVAALFLFVVGLHRFISARNARQVSSNPAIPLTEVADLSHQSLETEPVDLPQVEFQYAGSAQRVQTMLVEPGAVPPPVPPDLTSPSPTLERFTNERPRVPRPQPPPATVTAESEAYTPTPPAPGEEQMPAPADTDTADEPTPPPTSTTETAPPPNDW